MTKRTRPSRRELLEAEKSRKATNEKSFNNVVTRYKRESEELLKAHGAYTPLLPIISEETSLHQSATDHNSDDVMSSARSLPVIRKTPLESLSAARDDVTASTPCVCDSTQTFARVVTKDSQSGLFLAKSFIRSDSAKSSGDSVNSNKNKTSKKDFNRYKKLPPIAHK